MKKIIIKSISAFLTVAIIYTMNISMYVFAKCDDTELVENYIDGSDDIDSLCDYEKYRFIAIAVDKICSEGGYLSKVALAGVILKRIGTQSFPSDPVSVVFTDSQMADAFDADYSDEPSKEAISAVIEALRGLSPCPEALYFYNVNSSQSIYRKKTILYKNGDYLFS